MIYFMRADDDGPVKIGWSKNPVKRSFEVRPTPDTKLTIIRLLDGPKWVERWFHKVFADNRLQGEWFTFDDRMMTEMPPADEPERESTTCNGRTEQITVRLNVERVALMKAEAKAQRRSLAQQLEYMIDELERLDDLCAELEREKAELHEKVTLLAGDVTQVTPRFKARAKI